MYSRWPSSRGCWAMAFRSFRGVRPNCRSSSRNASARPGVPCTSSTSAKGAVNAGRALSDLRPRMRRPVDGAEAGGIDVGVALGSRQARVSEQFLDGAQVAARTEQMGGEGMAQGVRRHAVGEAKLMAQLAHALLHDGRVERRAARAEEQGVARAERR